MGSIYVFICIYLLENLDFSWGVFINLFIRKSRFLMGSIYLFISLYVFFLFICYAVTENKVSHGEYLFFFYLFIYLFMGERILGLSSEY